MRASMMGLSSQPLGAQSPASPPPPSPQASPASPQPPLPRPALPRGADPVTLPVAAKSAKLMQLGVSGLKARLRAPTMNLDVSTTPPLATPAPELQPIEVSETMRPRRSLLEPEATVATTAPPKTHFVEETRSLDVASLLDASPPPVDIFETLPPTRMLTMPPPSHKSTYLPLGGPDANPVLPVGRASMASPEPKSRANTVALDVSPFDHSTTNRLDDEAKETMRASRPLTMPPVHHETLRTSRVATRPPTRPSAPPSAPPLEAPDPRWALINSHDQTQPGIMRAHLLGAQPDTMPLETPSPKPPSGHASDTRWLVAGAIAIGAAVLAVLVIAMSNAAR
jgi:hypothetical protein